MSFTQDELKSYISQSLNEGSLVPSGHKGAFVAYVDGSGLRTAIAYRGDNGWEIAGTVAYHPHEDGVGIGFNIMKSW